MIYIILQIQAILLLVLSVNELLYKNAYNALSILLIISIIICQIIISKYMYIYLFGIWLIETILIFLILLRESIFPPSKEEILRYLKMQLKILIIMGAIQLLFLKL